MHLCMKIPRHTSKNPIAAGDLQWIFARNCEGTEQLRFFIKTPRLVCRGVFIFPISSPAVFV